jgi:coenzyme F420-dependent glucose-6-phosphate dehydrogenase
MNLIFGYVAATEEFSPPDLVKYGISSERNGLDAVWSSDHFHPWYDTNGHGGFSLAILSAVGALTKRQILGTSVTSPLFRYNPAVIAQAFATLGCLYSGRVFLGVGTGEALNEVPCGARWPNHIETLQRLAEAIVLIRKLWTENFVTFRGKYYRTMKANIYDKAQIPIPIHVAAGGPKGAELAGKLGDAFMTLPTSEPSLITDKLFPAVKKGAEAVGRRFDQVEKSLLIHVGFSKEDYEKALGSLMKWRATLLPVFFDLGAYDPRYIEQHGNKVSKEAIEREFLVATSEEDLVKFYERYIRMGFTHLSASPSGDVEGFLEIFGKKVVPYLRETYDGLNESVLPYRGTYSRDNLDEYLRSAEERDAGKTS